MYFSVLNGEIELTKIGLNALEIITVQNYKRTQN